MWFAPLVGFTATKAIPEVVGNVVGNAGNNPSLNNLQCVDTYGNSSTCTMKCKSLTTPVTLIETIAESNFDSFNCTLNLQATNGSISYALRIPQDNFLIYFTNWTTSEYQFSCSNNVTLPTSSMLCRRDFVRCLSTTVTNRYVPPSAYSWLFHLFI